MTTDETSLVEDAPARTFTGAQAARLLDLSYRQIDYWLGFLEGMNPGSGVPRTLAIDALYVLAIIREMRLVGLDIADAAEEAIKIHRSNLNVAQWSPSPNTHVSIDIQTLKEQVDSAVFESMVEGLEPSPSITSRFH